MGKMKKKPRRQKQTNNNPMGLEKHIEEEPENPVITNLLEKLVSSDEELRKCACTGIANLVTQPGTLMLFLKKNVVRMLGPLLLDESPNVQKEALGALRNISVCGSEEAVVCETMVTEDVMTPVVTLMQKYISASEAATIQHDACSIQILTEAAHLLWNLCESSEVAVKIFNQKLLHLVLMPVLKQNAFPPTLVLPVVQCLNTVSDGQSELCGHLAKDLDSLVNLLDWPQACHSDLLISMNIVGLLQNVCSCTECDTQLYKNVLEKSIGLIEKVLRIDLVAVLQNSVEAFQKAKSGDIMSPESKEAHEDMTAKETDLTHANGHQETDMVEDASVEENKEKEKRTTPHGGQKKPESRIDDVHDLVKAQILAVTLVSNLCCFQDDDSWEDMGSSDGSIEDVSMETESDVGENSGMGLSADKIELFNRLNLPQCVLSKCGAVDQTLMIQLASDRDTHSLLKSVKQVQVCSLVCLSNLLSVSEVTNQHTSPCDGVLGSDGIQFLQSAWQLLGPMLSACRKTDTELLEAETLALRAVLERLGKADANLLQQAGETDLQFLCELTQQCANGDSRANLLRLVACIGCALAKQPQPHPYLKGMGEFFCTVCSSEPEVWVIAECLDCIFDVFGEDHLNPILKEIHLIEKLQQIGPVLKVKAREQQGRLGEHAAIVSTARTNLTRFIKYKLPLIT